MVPVVHILKPDLQGHQLYGAEEVAGPPEVVRTRSGPVQNEVQNHVF